MLAVYLDASGMTGGDWAVMGGFVGDVEKWAAFERDWAELLAEPRYASLLPVKNGKRYVHARTGSGLAEKISKDTETFTCDLRVAAKRSEPKDTVRNS